jgi:heme/copper-type cytochrome/quinol oxidase subunit 4
MTSYFNYLSHITFNPYHDQRRFDYDLPSFNKKGLETVKRAALIALPFLSQYKPIRQNLSLAMGGIRCATHLSEAGFALSRKELLSFTSHIGLTALAVIALASTYFKFQVGLVFITTLDIVKSTKSAIQLIHAKKYDQAIEELLQATSSSVYLFILLDFFRN